MKEKSTSELCLKCIFSLLLLCPSVEDDTALSIASIVSNYCYCMFCGVLTDSIDSLTLRVLTVVVVISEAVLVRERK